MNTNLTKNTVGTNLPAGIIEGTEAFWYDDQKWLIHEGVSMEFTSAPTKIQNMIVEIFRTDQGARKILDKQGITKFSEQFDRWYRCRVGALDGSADFVNGNLNADAFNHMCKDYECELRGKLCSVSTGLKNYELKTLEQLMKGESIHATAAQLHISTSGLKSRIEKIKEKLGAKNMASLIAIACKIGI